MKPNPTTSNIIYQIFTGRWQSASLITHPKQVFTKLSDLNLFHLLEHNIDTLYFLGIFDNSGPIIVNQEEGQDISQTPHRLPSPFAITNHTAINPQLGTLKQFRQLTQKLQSQGFKIIIDFVPNHTATVHPWIKTNPDYYHYHDGNLVYEFSGDVCKLNYQNPDLKNQMIQVIQTLAGWGVNGVRCDMAHLIPNDFWSQATQLIRQNYPDFIFIAEAYTPDLFDLSPLTDLLHAGFNAIYHEPLYRNLSQHFKSHQPLSHLTAHLNHSQQIFSPSQTINYLSNHDDSLPAEATDYFSALFALTLFLPGIPFIYNGVLNGHHHRLAHHFYQELISSALEINTLPPTFQRLLQLKKQLQPQITNIHAKDNLLIAEVSTNKGNATLLLNLTQQSQSIPQLNQSSQGLIHKISPNQPIPPATFELFPDK